MIQVDVALKLGAFNLDVAFENGAGITALFGRSGSGKSMTINLMRGTTVSLVKSQDGRTRGGYGCGPQPQPRYLLTKQKSAPSGGRGAPPGPLESTQKWRMAGPRSNQRRAPLDTADV